MTLLDPKIAVWFFTNFLTNSCCLDTCYYTAAHYQITNQAISQRGAEEPLSPIKSYTQLHKHAALMISMLDNHSIGVVPQSKTCYVAGWRREYPSEFVSDQPLPPIIPDTLVTGVGPRIIAQIDVVVPVHY